MQKRFTELDQTMDEKKALRKAKKIVEVKLAIKSWKERKSLESLEGEDKNEDVHEEEERRSHIHHFETSTNSKNSEIRHKSGKERTKFIARASRQYGSCAITSLCSPDDTRFSLGQLARPSEMHISSSAKEALTRIARLRVGDGAWVKRNKKNKNKSGKKDSSGIWTYATLKERHEAHLVFIVNERNSKKIFPVSSWAKFIRVLAREEDCLNGDDGSHHKDDLEEGGEYCEDEMDEMDVMRGAQGLIQSYPALKCNCKSGLQESREQHKLSFGVEQLEEETLTATTGTAITGWDNAKYSSSKDSSSSFNVNVCSKGTKNKENDKRLITVVEDNEISLNAIGADDNDSCRTTLEVVQDYDVSMHTFFGEGDAASCFYKDGSSDMEDSRRDYTKANKTRRSSPKHTNRFNSEEPQVIGLVNSSNDSTMIRDHKGSLYNLGADNDPGPTSLKVVQNYNVSMYTLFGEGDTAPCFHEYYEDNCCDTEDATEYSAKATKTRPPSSRPTNRCNSDEPINSNIGSMVQQSKHENAPGDKRRDELPKKQPYRSSTPFILKVMQDHNLSMHTLDVEGDAASSFYEENYSDKADDGRSNHQTNNDAHAHKHTKTDESAKKHHCRSSRAIHRRVTWAGELEHVEEGGLMEAIVYMRKKHASSPPVTANTSNRSSEINMKQSKFLPSIPPTSISDTSKEDTSTIALGTMANKRSTQVDENSDEIETNDLNIDFLAYSNSTVRHTKTDESPREHRRKLSRAIHRRVTWAGELEHVEEGGRVETIACIRKKYASSPPTVASASNGSSEVHLKRCVQRSKSLPSMHPPPTSIPETPREETSKVVLGTMANKRSTQVDENSDEIETNNLSDDPLA